MALSHSQTRRHMLVTRYYEIDHFYTGHVKCYMSNPYSWFLQVTMKLITFYGIRYMLQLYLYVT